jgi:S1-C subfamily serine protease
MGKFQHIATAIGLWLFGISSLYARIEIGVGCIDADPRGAKVIEVKDPGYAKQMGLTIGDVIIMLNGKRVDKADSLARELAAAESATLTWRRGDKYFRGGVAKVAYTSEFGGFSYQVLTMTIGSPTEIGVDAVDERGKGAKVTAVRDPALGNDLGIAVGDVIVRVNENTIDGVEALKLQEEIGGQVNSLVWLRGKEYFFGTVHHPRPQLDKKGEPVPILRRGQRPAEMLGLGWERTREDKVRVINVRAGSWADDIGLRPGDLLLRADGNRIDDPARVELMLAGALPEPDLVWKRGDNYYAAQQSFFVEAVGRRFDERHFLRSSQKLAPTALGVRATADARGGVRITQVDPDGAGRRLRLLDGDIIVSINGVPVKTVEEFDQELAMFETGTIEWRRGTKHYKDKSNGTS